MMQADLAAAVAMLRRLLTAVNPAWVTAAAAAAGVLVALVAAITGLRSLRQLRTDSRERSRPMMAAELRKPPYTRGIQLLVIRNYGPSIARNVKVTFDPPIPEPIPERAAESVSPFIMRRYTNPIPAVTPGMELTNIWFSGRLEGNEWVNVERTPPQFTVTIAYDGPDGFPYKDSFPLDTDLIRGETYMSSSADPDNQIKEIGKSLTKIEKSLTHITRTIGSGKADEPATKPSDPTDLLNAVLGRSNASADVAPPEPPA
jgi:hypothetical protein